MSGEEYQLILWVLGNQPLELNQMAFVVLAVWSSLTLTGHILKRLYDHLEYQLDLNFWGDVMLKEQLSF